MSKFKKEGKKSLPAVSTASLPDIVFMLLFFFMVTTVMREVDLKVKVSRPEATEIEKLENKALVHYIYIGEPSDSEKYGTEPKIQIADDYAEVADVQTSVITFRESKNEAEVPIITYSLKVDQEAKMGIVTDVKQELREVYALKINYSTNERAK
jgi:biopolymer transport protein ExbD